MIDFNLESFILGAAVVAAVVAILKDAAGRDEGGAQ